MAKKSIQNNESNDLIRINGLVDAAIKISGESAKILSAAAAAACYQLVAFGRGGPFNRLYSGLQPKDQHGLRVFFVNRVHDLFGVGGEKREDDAEVWLKRPASFIRFIAKPQDGKSFFSLVTVGEGTNLSPVQIANIKAGKKAVAEAGEEALDIEWVTAAAERRMALAQTAADAQRKVANLIKDLAKNAHTNGMSRQNLQAMGKAAGLNSDTILNTLEFFNDGVKAETEKPETEKTEKTLEPLLDANGKQKEKGMQEMQNA